MGFRFNSRRARAEFVTRLAGSIWGAILNNTPREGDCLPYRGETDWVVWEALGGEDSRPYKKLSPVTWSGTDSITSRQLNTLVDLVDRTVDIKRQLAAFRKE